jgi:hypothetical protein
LPKYKEAANSDSGQSVKLLGESLKHGSEDEWSGQLNRLVEHLSLGIPQNLPIVK